MSSPFNQSQIDLPLATPPMIGRYDKPIAAGMATRFVKGTSGNPDGRPKQAQSAMDAGELAHHLLQFFNPR